MELIKFSELCHPTEKQKQGFELLKKFKFILYGGAMGGGKSYWLRWALVKLLVSFAKKYGLIGIRVGLFCEDYPALKDRHLSKIQYEFPEWLGKINKSDHEFILSPQYGLGVICFRNLDEVAKYQSAEFVVIAVDELTKNKKEVFDFLRTRLRWPGIPSSETRFLGGTNPGGIGHEWVKKLWIDKEFDEDEREKDLFAFLPAKAKDNPYLDKNYYKTLESLPLELRRAFLEGDWDIFKGQYFKEWRRNIHICEPFNIPSSWKRFICGDYGYAKPSAVYWCAVDNDGFVYVYRELYETELTYSALTKMIISLTLDNEDIRYWAFDPSIWARKGDELSGAEIMEQTYKEKTNHELKLLQGVNDRLNGWRVVREYLKPTLKDGKVKAKLQVFNTCHNFIRTFPSLIYDPIRVEDADTGGEDHSADAIRYGLMTKPISIIEEAEREREEKIRVAQNRQSYGYQDEV